MDLFLWIAKQNEIHGKQIFADLLINPEIPEN